MGVKKRTNAWGFFIKGLYATAYKNTLLGMIGRAMKKGLPANAYWTVRTPKVCFTRSREGREERQKWGENIQFSEELTGFRDGQKWVESGNF